MGWYFALFIFWVFYDLYDSLVLKLLLFAEKTTVNMYSIVFLSNIRRKMFALNILGGFAVLCTAGAGVECLLLLYPNSA